MYPHMQPVVIRTMSFVSTDGTHNQPSPFTLPLVSQHGVVVSECLPTHRAPTPLRWKLPAKGQRTKMGANFFIIMFLPLQSAPVG